MATYCKNCGYHIVKMNYSGGPEWMHQPPGASFQDQISRYCQTTAAEPGIVLEERFSPARVNPVRKDRSDG